MANKLKLKKGQSVSLSTPEVENGSLLINTSSGKIFLDDKGERIPIGGSGDVPAGGVLIVHFDRSSGEITCDTSIFDITSAIADGVVVIGHDDFSDIIFLCSIAVTGQCLFYTLLPLDPFSSSSVIIYIYGSRSSGQTTDEWVLWDWPIPQEPEISYSLDTPLNSNTEYYLRGMTSISLELPEGADDGDLITVNFISGQIPTTLSITGEVIGDTSYSPNADKYVELSFKYVWDKWVMLVSET